MLIPVEKVSCRFGKSKRSEVNNWRKFITKLNSNYTICTPFVIVCMLKGLLTSIRMRIKVQDAKCLHVFVRCRGDAYEVAKVAGYTNVHSI